MLQPYYTTYFNFKIPKFKLYKYLICCILMFNQLNDPKWKNSNDNSNNNLLKYNYSKLKNNRLDINIETIESNENANFPFKG